MESIEENFSSKNKIILNSDVKELLINTSRWTTFLAIVGFILVGIIIVAAFFMIGVSMTLPIMGSILVFMGIIYLGLAVLYLFPTLHLFNFSKNIKNGINLSNQQQLDLGFEKLKSFFKFMGIMTIVIVGLYILMLLFALAGSGMRSGLRF